MSFDSNSLMIKLTSPQSHSNDTSFHIVASNVLLFISSCCMLEEDLQIHEAILPNTWLHAFDEPGNRDGLLFRPVGFKEFTKPELRNLLTLKPDGRATYVIESECDIHKGSPDFIVNGTWNYLPDAKKLFILNTRGNISMPFKYVRYVRTILK